MTQPATVDRGALNNLLNYFKGSQSRRILYQSITSEPLKILADAGFASCIARKSYTGIEHTLTKSLIMWQVIRQKTLSMTSCKPEYLSGSASAQQTLWFQRLLSNIQSLPACSSTARSGKQRCPPGRQANIADKMAKVH